MERPTCLGEGVLGGVISSMRWSDIKERSRQLLRHSPDRERISEWIKRRKKVLICKILGGIPSDPEGKGLAGKNSRINSMCEADFRGKIRVRSVLLREG